MPIEDTHYRTRYDEAVARERELRDLCRAIQDTRDPPDDLYRRWLRAAQDVWRLRARIRRRR